MDVKELKRILADDTSKVMQILSTLGFHDFSENNEEIRCALPDKANASAVMIKKNETLYTSLFELGYNGDLIGALQKVKDWSFVEAFDYITNILGISTKTSQIMIDPLRELKGLSRGISQNELKENKQFDERILDRFIPLVHNSLLEEGISPEVVKRFNILFDIERQRIIFPHYDWNKHQMIVGIKGRTVYSQQEIDILGIPKYWNYIKGYRKMLNLYGYSETCRGIKENKRIILFEGEKSVLKECTYEGIGSSVALGGHAISQSQSDFILSNTSSDCEIILAFDKDVWTKKEEGESYVKEIAGQFKPFRRVKAIVDKHNILGEKDSPIDKGYKVWQYLLKWREEI